MSLLSLSDFKMSFTFILVCL